MLTYEIETQIYDKLLYEYVLGIIENLPDKESEILKLRFNACDYMTIIQISKSLGITKERIRMIEARALRKVRILVKNDKRY